MKTENYITVQGVFYQMNFPTIEHVIAYSIIYGFSQDGESKFKGGIRYMMDALMCGKGKAIKVLQYLTENAYIIQTEEKTGRFIRKYYEVNREKLDHFLRVSKTNPSTLTGTQNVHIRVLETDLTGTQNVPVTGTQNVPLNRTSKGIEQLEINKGNKNASGDFSESRKSPEPPTIELFLGFVSEDWGRPLTNEQIAAVTLKFKSWRLNGWKTGTDRPIKNWKTTWLNTREYVLGTPEKPKHVSTTYNHKGVY